VVIRNVAGHHAPEMALAEHDHVVQALAPEGSDQSLRVRILPRAGRTRDDLSDTHAGDATPERIAIDGVAIPQQPSRRRVVRKGFNHLLGCPRCRGMFRDVDVHNSPALMREQDQYEYTRPVRVGTVKKSIDTSVAT
jgi:hypothetical protein